MTFFYGTTVNGADMQGDQLTIQQDGRYTRITIDEELRDRLLLELLGDCVIDGPEQDGAIAFYNAVSRRIDERNAA